jgi:predicted Zn-dependent protease
MNMFNLHNFVRISFCAILIITLIAVNGLAHARKSGGNSPIIIRDTEIEAAIKKWAEPVIKAADLAPESVNFIIVQDSSLNAFVAGGPNIFIYTGLLRKTETVDELIGVIAHELGHIRGGHLVRTRDAFENAAYENMLGTLVGVGAAIITGNGGVGAAVSAGSRSMAQNRLLSFSRVQESSADHAAMNYLEKAKMSPNGLLSFMKKLQSQEMLPTSYQSEYVRTHPLTKNRIDTIEKNLGISKYSDQTQTDLQKEEHARILAKLKGFITPERIEWDYDISDKSIATQYARAIASYRNNDMDQSLSLISELLEKETDNPFFLELKGQILLEFGKVEESIPYYKKSVSIYPNGPLIRTSYAHALIESAGQDGTEKLEEAIIQLERATRDEPRSTRNHRLLATAYGRLGKGSEAKLHLAEEALLKGDKEYAKKQAEAALEDLEKGSTKWLRAKDILSFIEYS